MPHVKLYDQKSPNSIRTLYTFEFQVVWPALEEGAQFFYMALRKMELSGRNYDELLNLYNQEWNRLQNKDQNGLNQNLVISENNHKDEADILRKVACKWLNQKSKVSPFVETMNYDRWSTTGAVKQKLKIGGIFPMSGLKYRAPELVPGT